MSLPDFSPQQRLFSVQGLLGPAFPSDDRFRLFAEKIYPLLSGTRPQLAECYCLDNGRAAVEPVVLLGVSILQFMERVSDSQAVELVKYHLGWKLALRLDPEPQAFHPTTLVYFRQRLLEHQKAKLAFDQVLQGLIEAGLVPRRGKQRLDSTHVLGLVAQFSALDCVRETMRLALQQLARQEGLTRPAFWARLWERYVESKLDYRAEEPVLQGKFIETGQDMTLLAAWVRESGGQWQSLQQVQLLMRVLEENYQTVEGTAGTLQRRQPRPGGAVQNPHDAEATWSSKGKGESKKSWVGYKAQVAETVEERTRQSGEPTATFLTAIVTQGASESEGAGMAQALEEQKASGLEPPPQLLVDSGYVSAGAMQEAAEQGRELVGPALGAPGRAGFTAESFKVDVENRVAVCPQGKESSHCSRLEVKETGVVNFRFEWSGQCRDCPLREQCVGQGQSHRTLLVGQHHTILQQRREEMKTPRFGERMRQRNAIEGTHSELVRGHGLRRARYRGLEKVRLQNYLIGAACNVKRWIRRIVWNAKQSLGQAIPAPVAASG
jgi:transposase